MSGELIGLFGAVSIARFVFCVFLIVYCGARLTRKQSDTAPET